MLDCGSLSTCPISHSLLCEYFELQVNEQCGRKPGHPGCQMKKTPEHSFYVLRLMYPQRMWNFLLCTCCNPYNFSCAIPPEDNWVAMQPTQAVLELRPLCWLNSVSMQNIAPSVKATIFGKGRFWKTFGLKTGGRLWYWPLRTLKGWTWAKEVLWLFQCMPENDPVTGIKSMREVEAKHKGCFCGCFSGPLNQSIKLSAFC